MQNKNIKILSLFDGISACQQAFKNLGIPVARYFASEIDPYAIKITQKNFPETIQLGDVKDIGCYYNMEQFILTAKNFETDCSIDLLCGGSPCQDLSIAKKDRKGLDGERSGLFYEYIRILKEVKPKFFILENVASMSKESKELISKELFNIEPILINSSLLTAQQRKRLYWVGALQQDGTYKKVEIEQPQDKGILLKDILETNVDKNEFLNQKLIDAIKKSNYQDRKPYDINKKCGTCKCGGDKKRIIDNQGNWRYLTLNEICRLQGFPDKYVNVVSKTQGYKALGNSFTVPVIEHILKTLFQI